MTGSRIKLLSLDASPNYIILGSSIGSVYVFGRCGEFGGLRDPARTKIESPEGPLRFLERFLVETHSGASASKPIVAIRLNPAGTRCALAFEDGELEVVEFSMVGVCRRRPGSPVGRRARPIDGGTHRVTHQLNSESACNPYTTKREPRLSPCALKKLFFFFPRT